jgi:CDP-glucose 4,6-dehydratase
MDPEMADFQSTFSGARVLVTGHTGFCGSWLTLWLKQLGAEVMGISLPPNTEPSLFRAAKVKTGITHREIDICDVAAMTLEIKAFKPQFVFHLAAQALVRPSYSDPVETFRVNTLGTACILEACRTVEGVKAAVLITTDKVYENKEWVWPYREGDPLGGKDPYSASKAAAELVASSYRRTMAPLGNDLALATARGGNIIGGGDWSIDRLIPDFVRACTTGAPIVLRNPAATRPWQHVLCLCHGYLVLADRLARARAAVQEAYNFGPRPEDVLSVRDVVDRFAAGWKPVPVEVRPSNLPEAGKLAIDSTRAETELGWRPAWKGLDGISRTADWYAGYYDRKQDARDLCEAQIKDYRGALG